MVPRPPKSHGAARRPWAMPTAAAWAAAQAFHHMRRHFLRQLLLDLCAALRAMRRTYWVDFGSLLGIHRDGARLSQRGAPCGRCQGNNALPAAWLNAPCAPTCNCPRSRLSLARA